jgi:hypothetical protein
MSGKFYLVLAKIVLVVQLAFIMWAMIGAAHAWLFAVGSDARRDTAVARARISRMIPRARVQISVARAFSRIISVLLIHKIGWGGEYGR